MQIYHFAGLFFRKPQNLHEEGDKLSLGFYLGLGLLLFLLILCKQNIILAGNSDVFFFNLDEWMILRMLVFPFFTLLANIIIAYSALVPGSLKILCMTGIAGKALMSLIAVLGFIFLFCCLLGKLLLNSIYQFGFSGGQLFLHFISQLAQLLLKLLVVLLISFYFSRLGRKMQICVLCGFKEQLRLL